MVIGAHDPLGAYLCRELQRHRAVVHAVFQDRSPLTEYAYEIGGMQLLQRGAPVVDHPTDDMSQEFLGSLMMETLPDELYWVNASPEILHVPGVENRWADNRLQQASAILESYRAYCFQRGEDVPLVHTIQGWPAGLGAGPAWIGRRSKWRTIASIDSSAQSVARAVCRGYREKYGLWVANAALSLNESPLDCTPRWLRKIVRAALRACAGLPASLCLGDPDELGDWGFTGDYATAVRLIVEQDAPSDYCVSTGHILSLRQVLESVFGRFGLSWESYCELDPAMGLPALPDDYVDSPGRLQNAAGWQPHTSFDDLVEMLLQTEQAEVSAELLSRHGSWVNAGEVTNAAFEGVRTAEGVSADGTAGATTLVALKDTQSMSGMLPQIPSVPLMSFAIPGGKSEFPVEQPARDSRKTIASGGSSKNYSVAVLHAVPEIVPGKLVNLPAEAKPARRVAVLGHKGMIGSAIVRRLFCEPNVELVLHPTMGFDLTNLTHVERFIEEQRPAELYLAAGRVAGERTRFRLMADFLRENLQITLNVLDACARFGVEKLMCFSPESLASESTDIGLVREAACLKQAAEAYRHQFGIPVISVFPSPVHGAGGRLEDDSLSPVLAMVSRILQAIRQKATVVTLDGSENDSLVVIDADSLADAAIFLMQRCRFESVGVVAPGCLHRGTVARTVARSLGFRGDVIFGGCRRGSESWQGPPITAIDLGWRFPIEAEDSVRRMANSYRIQYLEERRLA